MNYIDMARDKRDRSKVNYLEGQIRHLSRENKHLKKQLARADKAVNKLHNATLDIVDEIEPIIVTKEDKCPNCKSKLSLIDLGPKTVVVCKSCSYRKIQKT